MVLTGAERQQLRQFLKQQRAEAGSVKVTVILLLNKRRPLATIADDLEQFLEQCTSFNGYTQYETAPGLAQATVHRYARAFGALGVGQYLAYEQPVGPAHQCPTRPGYSKHRIGVVR